MAFLELSLCVVAVCNKPFQFAYLADFAFRSPVFSVKDGFAVVLQESIGDARRLIGESFTYEKGEGRMLIWFEE